MKQARWEKIVAKVQIVSARDGMGPVVLRSTAMTLLARQHAWFVRMVKRVAKEYESTLEESSAEHLRDDILAALATRGGKK